MTRSLLLVMVVVGLLGCEEESEQEPCEQYCEEWREATTDCGLEPAETVKSCAHRMENRMDDEECQVAYDVLRTWDCARMTACLQ